MNKNDIFYQTNAFAMQYGMVFGAIWCIGFFSFIFYLQYPMLLLVCLFATLSVPFIGIKLTKIFRAQVSQSGTLSFRRAYLFSLLLYLYASILLALLTYVYFEYLDGGMFLNSYEAFLSSPEVQQQLSTPEMQQLLNSMTEGKTLNSIVEVLRSFSPITIAANTLDSNIFFGLILSLPTAFVCKKTTPNIPQNN